MMADAPGKSEIDQIFKRLRSVAANKVCFDCGSKNPTWASITYGIFICIDCSGIHRSLGVHLTFIRSTNLDTNWTWQQLRQMQLGGNAKALTFFRSQNCTTKDTQMKYNSRASQLYRDKLQQAATQAMRLHGSKIHIDAFAETEPEPAAKVDDFFDTHESFPTHQSEVDIPVGKPVASQPIAQLIDDGAAPNVDLALSTSPSAAAPKPAPKKSTIGSKKPAGKKGGMGAKKGLGAQKVGRDFAAIEAEAEMADQIVTSRMEMKKAEPAKNPEEEAKAMANMRLAYQDMSVQQSKEEERLKRTDPSKAAQVERLGMGFGGFGGGGKSHNLLTEMSEIRQEEPSSGNSHSSFSTSTKEKFFDDFEIVDVEKDDLPPWRTSSSRVDDLCSAPTTSKTSAWENDLNENTKKSTYNANSWDNDFQEKRKPAPSSTSYSGGGASDDAVKKFGNAKSISSDMFFDDKGANDRDANLSRFQGSSSISSDMYFNRDAPAGGMNRSASSYSSNMQAPDMDDVKESVKQGVNKVAGRLSNMASGMMNQIQDRYGY
jgi:ADP-ribosylation factor GTPase-activating protein 2/3